MRRLFMVLCLSLMALTSIAQTSIQVQTHNVVSLDEQFSVSFIIEGGRPSDFEWEPGEDFMLLWGPQQGRSSSVQIINGKRTESSQTTYSYVLKPVKAGKFTLPKASAKVGGKEIYSNETTVEVVSSDNSSSSSSSASSSRSAQASAPSSSSARQRTGDVSNQDIFLVMNLDRHNVVVGEPITATLKLYQRVNIDGFEGADFPDFDGFWSQETKAPSNIQFIRENYGGQIYNSALLREYVLIPQHSGNIEIDPAELVCLVSVRVSSGGSSIFDGFFDDYATVRKKVTSKPVTVNVRQLPSNAPASYAGGVGLFTVSASLTRDSLKTHEAASLILKVSGKGNISLLETPKITFPLDMESYDPKVTSNISSDGLSGSRIYEYPFIPRSAGDFEIGPLKYSYYDIDQKRYVTIETPALPIRVERGNETDGGSVMVSGMSPRDVRNLDTDIRFINTKTPEFRQKDSFLIGSSLFWAMTLGLSAAFIIAWITLRKVAARKADVVGMKNRKATKMALRRLRLAGSYLKNDKSVEFYTELHRALLGYVSDKLNMPVSELLKDRMSAAMLERGATQEQVTEFMAILDSCEFARYAPAAGNQAMTTDYERAVEAISSIDSSMKSKKSAPVRTMAVVMLLLSPLFADASEMDRADSLWNAANEQYAQGNWADAISSYDAISQMGLESAALYCNTANAWFKEGNYAKAILYYERALILDPSYQDARFNLELVNGRIQDRIESVPEFFLKEWLRNISDSMSSDTWAVTFIVLFAVTLTLLLVFILSPSVVWKKIGFFTSIVTLILTLTALSFSIWQKNSYTDSDGAIVMKTVTSVKSSPSSDISTDLFILHEGTKVHVLETMGDWTNVSLSDGRQGWMKSSDIEII